MLVEDDGYSLKEDYNACHTDIWLGCMTCFGQCKWDKKKMWEIERLLFSPTLWLGKESLAEGEKIWRENNEERSQGKEERGGGMTWREQEEEPGQCLRMAQPGLHQYLPLATAGDKRRSHCSAPGYTFGSPVLNCHTSFPSCWHRMKIFLQQQWHFACLSVCVIFIWALYLCFSQDRLAFCE